MKSSWALVALFLGMLASLGFSGNAWAGTDRYFHKPELTPPVYVAMLYYKMMGKEPDFNAWASKTEEYQKAGEFDKFAVQDNKANEFRSAFGSITMEEPIIVDFPVNTSSYSRINKGYFIENFQEDTFLEFEFMGIHYAIVPDGAQEKQWMFIDEKERPGMESVLLRHRAVLTLILEPRSVDKTGMIKINDQDYYLLLAKIKDMAFYDRNGVRIWNSEKNADAVEKDLSQKQLMSLYR